MITGLLLASCATFDRPWIPGTSASMAQDQIMLVRKNPPSLGYRRLETQSEIYPDLGFFVSKKGLPDFMAETGDRNRHYFILYFLKAREAFACRTRPRNPGTVEFAGPYPVTDGEYRRLETFRRNQSP
jgi:hypothetical protein